MSQTAMIVGTGRAIPEKVLTNDDLSKLVETSDQWITERTGIKERHIAAPGQTASDLGAIAAREALDRAGTKPGEVDLIIVATMCPEMVTPSTASILQAKIGAKNAAAVDIQAACSGFMYGLAMARSAIASGDARCVLLVGAEVISPFMDWKDRQTCILFGDAAGAAVLKPATDGRGVLSTVLGADGTGAPLIEIPAGGGRKPASHETVDAREHFLRMQGREIFKNGVRTMTQAVVDAIAKAGVKKDDLALLIPHQANKRIIDMIVDNLGLPPEKLFLNVEKYGNTSGASVPVALHEAVLAGRVRPGDLVCMVAFGAGLTWGSAVVRW